MSYSSADRNLTKKFQVAVRLFSSRSQMTSKCGKNKKAAHEVIAECVTVVLTTFPLLLAFGICPLSLGKNFFQRLCLPNLVNFPLNFQNFMPFYETEGKVFNDDVICVSVPQ